ncbi:hypothetical protein SAMN02746019_00010930 [Thermoflexus hugenholtzii JAD2]|jgi:hypothetical protein|uniref:Uncharacterized protein n=1 Tax=Thermoflexus hugenholtzii JAD2 TaxID=877466 RepID=A0A212RCJ1_9CHLR|nr:hypothetical protein SAMN02746019_00010930 [Thermoflexus hugenholtzii JAD2]
MAFRELTDGPWAFIEPPLPSQAQTGRSRVDDRKGLHWDPACPGHRLPGVR